MNRTKKFVDGVVLSYGYQALVMLVGLWLTPFLLHRLGQHDFGVWLVGLQALTYLALLDIGVIGLLPREVAFVSGRIHLGAEPPKALRTLLEENVVVVLWQTPILWVAMGIAWLALLHRGADLKWVSLIIFATYGIQFPLRIFFAALEGLQDFAFIGYLQMAAWCIGVIVNVTSVYKGYGLYGLAFGWSMTQAIIAFGSIGRVYFRYFEFAPRTLRWLPVARIWKYLQAGFWVSLSQVSQMLVKGADVVLLASLRGPSAVVPYACSTKLQSVLANQPQLILQAAQPGLTQLRATAEREHVGRVIGTLAQAMLMVSGAAAAVILAVNKGFVQKWVGPDQFLGFWFTVWIVVGMLLRHLNGTTVYSLFCFGKERFISIVALCDSVCFAVLTYFFVRLFGTIGIPLASIASVSLVSLPWTLRELKGVTGLSVWAQLTPVREWFLPFSVVGVAVGIGVQFFNPSSYYACAIVVTLVVAIYFAVEYPVIRRSLWGNRLRDVGRQMTASMNAFFRPRLRPPLTDLVQENEHK
jgi:O-antigen/teichoic acid export membrane protein